MNLVRLDSKNLYFQTKNVTCSVMPASPKLQVQLREALGYFFSATFLDYCGCLVHWETDFVAFWVNFDQNEMKEERPKFDKLMARGLILMVK